MEPRGLLFGSRRAAASSAATCSRRSLNVAAVVFVVFFFPLLIVAAAAGNTTAAARVAVDVGVILDLATALGKKSMLSMEMALEDVYAAHPEFATRVALRARDSRGDVVAAASAAIDLIRNENVAIVIGPQSTLQAEFVTYLANKTKVPVITFSATGDAVTRYHVPYFIRACSKDSYQVASIAAFVKAYEWRNVVLVYEDNNYGVGILPSITDALQGVGVNVINRSAFPAYSPNNHIDVELYKLMTMQTRVFIVHMLPARASRLFARAKALGMMTKGYVWIVTDSIGIVLDVLPQHSIESMEGIVGFRPYIADSTRITDFSSRFTTLFRTKYHPNTDIRMAKPTIFQLWAYDVAWAVATATEKVHRTRSLNPTFHPLGNIGKNLVDDLPALPAGPELLNSILQGEFDGLAGQFRLIDRHLQVPTYEIVNVIGEKTRVIRFWSPDSGLTMSTNSTTIHGDAKFSTSSSELKNIIWPGDSTTVPKGWDFPVNAKILRIGVPLRHDFKTFVNVEINPNTNRSTVSGYSIDMFEAAVKKLPYALRYEYIPYDCAGSYDQLVSQVFFKKFDAAVGDVTIIANRTRYVDFTMPYTESGVSMLVLSKSDDEPTTWIFLQPLAKDLWIATMIFIFFTGLVVWVIERPINRDFQGSKWKQCITAFYFAFSTLTFSHGQKIQSIQSKIVVSYTASLSSMLTAERLQPSVTDLKQLLANGDSVGHQNGSFVQSILKKLKFDDHKIKVYSTQEEYAKALRMGSKHGGVSAIFDEIPYLNSFCSKYGREFQMVGPIDRTSGFGFVLPKGSPLVPDLSEAILSLTEEPERLKIEKTWFMDSSLDYYGSHSKGSSRISFQSFQGLFIIVGCLLGAVLLINFSKFLYDKCKEMRGFGSDRVHRGERVVCFGEAQPQPPLIVMARRLAMAAAATVAVLLVVWSSPAAAAGGDVSVALEAYRLDPNGSGSRTGAITAAHGDAPVFQHACAHAGRLRHTKPRNRRAMAPSIQLGGETKRTNAGVRRDLGALPRGYGKELKIAVPWKPGFKAFLNVTDRSVGGYCIDVFEAAVKKLPHHLSYKFVVFNGSYDELVQRVSSGNYDAAVGDVTITAERTIHADFTMPYTESGVSMLVLMENDSKSTIEWVFLKPLTRELWVATVIFFLFTGIVIWMIERPRNLEYQGSSSRQFSTALYFSFSTLTFSHGHIIKSPLSKIVVSYTASLSSILTAKKLRPSETDLEQILFDGDYVGYQRGSFVESFLIKQGFSKRRLRPYTKKQEYAEALRKGSMNGGVSAIVFPPGFPLVHNLSTAILDVTGGDEGSQIEAKWFGTTAAPPSYAIPNTDSTPLTLRSFSVTPELEILMCEVLMRMVEMEVAKNVTQHKTSWVMAMWMIDLTMKSELTVPRISMGSVSNVLTAKSLDQFRMALCPQIPARPDEY
uniref:Ionotropic glutamate receptor C-terminal domain-containing protein n=1 Tax=Oryza nivara TaxID=4536 RepID=A0A0E0HM05_ORYNI